MKRMQKFLILFTMLFTGLSFKGANTTNKMVVADAAETETKPEPDSYAYLGSFGSTLTSKLKDQGVTDVSLIKSILFTNDRLKVPMSGYLNGCPLEVGRKGSDYTPENYYTDGYAVMAYVYPNETMFDCIIYANVEKIYLNGSWLLYNFLNVETITFDCNMDMDKSMRAMFFGNEKLTQIVGLDRLNTDKVEDMYLLFYNCESLVTVDVSSFDTSKVTIMAEMFRGCKSLTTIKGLESKSFDTSSVTDMGLMFYNCDSLTTLDVSNFDTSKVTKMNSMFDSCDKLTTIKGLNSEKFVTSNVTNMQTMFSSCTSLTSLDLSNFDLSAIPASTEVNNPNLLFFIYDDKALTEIKAPKNMNGMKIDLPSEFGMTTIDSSMEGWTILKGSKEFNILYNTLLKINVCTEYTQAPELQTMYDKLSNEEKDKLATLTDESGVVLTDKLSYMVGYADYKANETTTESGTHLVLSEKTSQYLVLVIACFSLAMLGGYYYIQKKKYAK